MLDISWLQKGDDGDSYCPATRPPETTPITLISFQPLRWIIDHHHTILTFMSRPMLSTQRTEQTRCVGHAFSSPKLGHSTDSQLQTGKTDGIVYMDQADALFLVPLYLAADAHHDETRLVF
ncbi:hypothetical protein PoB_003985200 [Plakobranchus ocellatus]|uniref:Uncharacterized protein n=1 Tax=Plakobranchus ocellatus TaxID=259542 RepID=A0AAV4B2A0_9GAST|nr:hypothetical protein PoB_003985200 [Plakobranchus ocellatus]